MAEIDYDRYQTSRPGLYILVFLLLLNSCAGGFSGWRQDTDATLEELGKDLQHIQEMLEKDISGKSE